MTKTLSITKSKYYFRPFYSEIKQKNGHMRYEPQLPREIVIVGCGGNGGYLVPLVARFISQSPAEMIRNIKLTLVDGDNVEDKNILRQNFISIEKGLNKAEALADRCNRAFGMDIKVHTEYLTAANIGRTIGSIYDSKLIIGCVDRHEVRNLISHRLSTNSDHNAFYIDVGNELEAGQLFLSGRAKIRPETDSGKINQCGIHIHELYPTIGKSDMTQASPSCDENTVSGRQRMVVNVKAATLAFEAMEAVLSPAELSYYEITFGPGASRTLYLNDLKIREGTDGRGTLT